MLKDTVRMCSQDSTNSSNIKPGARTNKDLKSKTQPTIEYSLFFFQQVKNYYDILPILF